MFYMPVWVAFELQYITLSQLALIEAIIQGSQLLSELPTGAIADLLGKRISVIIGRAIMIIAMLLYVRATTFTDFIVYAVICGFADSFVSGALDAMVYDSLKQDGKSHLYTKVSSKESLIFQIAFVAAIISGGILSLWGYVVAINATIIGFLCSLVISFWFTEPAIDTQVFTLKTYIRQFRQGFRELFKSPYVRDISLFYVGVGGITWSAMMIFNTSLLTTIGYTTFEIGIIVSIIRLLNSSLLFGAIHLNTIITKKRVYLFFPILMIMCYLPGILLSKELAILAVAGSIFASTARWVILGNYVNEHYESKNRATALSTLSMMVSLSVVGFALLSDPVMHYLGGVRATFTMLGIATACIVLPLGLRISRKYHTATVTV